MEELEKYILEQANIEVEYTRSWPNQLLAFYVAINFGISSAFLAFVNGNGSGVPVSDCAKFLLTIGVAIMFIWTIWLLGKNHLSYLEYRNIQIQFQKAHIDEKKKLARLLPETWFELNKISVFKRWVGWGFYAFTVVFVTAITCATIWSKY